MGIRFGQRLCQSYARKQQSTHSNFLEKIKETRFHEVPGKECLVTKATIGQLDTAVLMVIILHPLLKKMYLIWGNKKLLVTGCSYFPSSSTELPAVKHIFYFYQNDGLVDMYLL